MLECSEKWHACISCIMQLHIKRNVHQRTISYVWRDPIFSFLLFGCVIFEIQQIRGGVLICIKIPVRIFFHWRNSLVYILSKWMLNRKIPKKLQQNQDKVCMHHWGLIYTPSLQTAIDSWNIKPQASPTL